LFALGVWYNFIGRREKRWGGRAVRFTIETEQEVDGRWIAEVPELPGVLAYGATQEEAAANAEALALRVMGERRGAGAAKQTLQKFEVEM
jgi:predicted RNase H-like HicB family nuclease